MCDDNRGLYGVNLLLAIDTHAQRVWAADRGERASFGQAQSVLLDWFYSVLPSSPELRHRIASRHRDCPCAPVPLAWRLWIWAAPNGTDVPRALNSPSPSFSGKLASKHFPNIYRSIYNFNSWTIDVPFRSCSNASFQIFNFNPFKTPSFPTVLPLSNRTQRRIVALIRIIDPA